MPEQQVPSVGRIVHYFSYGTPGGEFPAAVARAAIITEVDEPGSPESAVGLAVFNPSGMYFDRHIQHVEYGKSKSGRWAWPVYVSPVAPGYVPPDAVDKES